MKLLAIDTSGENCSCALALDGDISTRCERAPRRHAELLLPMVADLLETGGTSLRELDALAFGCGPGSFTGLRIAAGVVQGLARGAHLPVVPVSSLRALAQCAYRRWQWESVVAAFDARMGEIYAGAYVVDRQGLMQSAQADTVCAPDSFVLPSGAGSSWHGVGSAWPAYAQLLADSLHVRTDAVAGSLEPEARDVALLAQADFGLGKAVDAAQAIPVYLRNQVAKTTAEREREKN